MAGVWRSTAVDHGRRSVVGTSRVGWGLGGQHVTITLSPSHTWSSKMLPLAVSISACENPDADLHITAAAPNPAGREAGAR